MSALDYPIVPSFRDWTFPHPIPDIWPKASLLSNPVATRCVITNCSYSVESAHLVPEEEAVWYDQNGMWTYGESDLSDINSMTNRVFLRPDMRRCFDKRWFAIVPKASVTEGGGQSFQYVTHILSEYAAELWPEYHNILVQHVDQKSHPYLLARFAWAILLNVKPFVTQAVSRYVIRLQTDSSGKVQRKAELVTGLALQGSYGGGGTKAATPKRRKPATATPAEDDSLSTDSSSDDSDADWGDRGNRKRRPMSSEETAPDVEALRQSLLEGLEVQKTAPQERVMLSPPNEMQT